MTPRGGQAKIMAVAHQGEHQNGVTGASGLPRWARDLKERIDARMTSVFVLHFNVADEVRFGDRSCPPGPFWDGGSRARSGRSCTTARVACASPMHDTEALFRKVTGLTRRAEAAKRRALTALGEAVAAGA